MPVIADSIANNIGVLLQANFWDHRGLAAAMSAFAFANLTTRTYVVDTAVKILDSRIDGGNSDEQANKSGDDLYSSHTVGHIGS